MFLARVLRRLAFLIFWLMSAYLVIVLVIALSEQGQMTGDLAATNQAPGIYPMWYAAPDVQDAARLGIILYPIAAVAFLIASLIGFASSPAPADAAERMPDWQEEKPAEPAPALTPVSGADGLRGLGLRAPGTLCALDRSFVIQAIGPDAADLFGLEPAQLVGRPILPLILPMDAGRLEEAVRAVHASPDQPVSLDISIRQPDETVLKVQAQCHARTASPGSETVLRLLPVSERGSLNDQLSAIWY